MANIVRWCLAAEVLIFAVAALVHAGVLLTGYEHREARIAESVIGLVLLAGLLTTVAAPRFARRAGLGAQGFALLGTMVGLFTIAVGIGPRSVFDLVLHSTMIIVLVTGLIVVSRQRVGTTGIG